MLLRQLPPGARTVRALGGEVFDWNIDTHLLASIVDLLAAANWQRGGGKGPRPRPIERPGVDTPGRETKTMGTPLPKEEARRILDDWGT